MFPLLITIALLLMMIASVLVYRYKWPQPFGLLLDERFVTLIALLIIASCFALIRFRTGDRWHERYEKDQATVVSGAVNLNLEGVQQLCQRLQGENQLSTGRTEEIKLNAKGVKQLFRTGKTDCNSEWQRSHFSGKGSTEVFLAAFSRLNDDFKSLKQRYQETENALKREQNKIAKAESAAINTKERWYDSIVGIFSAKVREEQRQRAIIVELGGVKQILNNKLSWLGERYGQSMDDIETDLAEAREEISKQQWNSAYLLLSEASRKNRVLRKSFIDSEAHVGKAGTNFVVVPWGIPFFTLLCFAIQLILSKTVLSSLGAKRLLYPGFVLFTGLGLCLLGDISLNYLPKLRYIYLDSWSAVIMAHLLLCLVAVVASRPTFLRISENILNNKPLASFFFVIMLVGGMITCKFLNSYIASEVIKLLLLVYMAWFAARHGGYIAGRAAEAGSLSQLFDRGWFIKNFNALLMVLATVTISVVLKHDFGPLLLMLLLIGLMVWVVLGRLPFAILSLSAITGSAVIYILRDSLKQLSWTAHIFDRFSEMAAPFSTGTGETALLILLRHAAGPFGFDLGGIPYWGHAMISINSPVTPAQLQSDYTVSHIVAQFGYLGGGLLMLLFFAWVFSMFATLDPNREGISRSERFLTWFALLGLLLLMLQFLLTCSGNFSVFALTGVTMPLVSFGKTALLASSLIFGVVYSLGYQPVAEAKNRLSAKSGEKILYARLGWLRGVLLVSVVVIVTVAVWRDSGFAKNQIIRTEKQVRLMEYAVSSLREFSSVPYDYIYAPGFSKIAGSDKEKAHLYSSLVKIDRKLEKIRAEGLLKKRYYIDLDSLYEKLSQDRQTTGSIYDKAVASLLLIRLGNRLAQLDWRENLPRNRQDAEVSVAKFLIANQKMNNPWGPVRGELLFSSPKADGSLLRLHPESLQISRQSKLTILPIKETYPNFSMTGMEPLLQQDLATFLDYEQSKGMVRPDNKVTIGGMKFKSGYDVLLTIDVPLQQMALAILNEELKAAHLKSATVTVMDAESGDVLAAAAASSSSVFTNVNGIPLVLQEIPPASTSKLVFAAAVLENYGQIAATNQRLKKTIESLRVNLKDSITPYFYQLALDHRLAPLFRDQAQKMGWNNDCIDGGLCTGGIPDYLYGLQKTTVSDRKYPIAGRLFVKDIVRADNQPGFSLLTDTELANLPTAAELDKAIKNKINGPPYDSGKLVRLAVAGQGTNRSSSWGEIILMSHIIAASQGRETFPLPHMVRDVLNVKGEKMPFNKPERVKTGISQKSAATMVSYLSEVNITGTGHKAGFEQVFGRKARTDEMFIGKTGTTDIESDESARPYNLYVGAFASKPGGKIYDRILVAIIERDKTKPRLRPNSAATIAFRMVRGIRESKNK